MLEAGEIKDTKKAQQMIETHLDLFKKWDYRFEQDSLGASLFTAWEYNIYRLLHEYKIQSEVARLAIASSFMYESFVFG